MKRAGVQLTSGDHAPDQNLEGIDASSRDMAPIIGRVKWFDAGRGFGFLISDEIDGDILLHSSVLREHGRRSIPEGCSVEFVPMRHERGLQAERVLSIDLSSALPVRPRSPDSPVKQAQRRALHETAGEFEPVEVKWFDRIKGFGFVKRGCEDEDIFVHMDSVRQAGLRELQMGQKLQARVAPTPKGLTAVELRAPR